ncbi:MAG: alpha/beta hydrolase-fold protein [Bacteroidota bacterium]
MRLLPMRLLYLLLLLVAVPAQAQQATIAFAIDMTEAVEAGWFSPANERVGVRGAVAPLSWDRSLAAEDADGDGVYTLTLPFEVASDSLVLAYKFHAEGGGNEPNGGWESGPNRQVVLYPGQPAAVARRFDEPVLDYAPTFTGTIEVVEDVSSAHLDLSRDVFVYLPPGYADDLDRRYPVLYVHDGQHAFDAADGAEWGYDETAQALIAAGEIEPVIIVGVGNTARRTDEYTQTVQTWRHTLTRTDEAPQGGDASDLLRFTGRYALDATPEEGLDLEVRDGTLVGRLPGQEIWNSLEQVDPLTFYVSDLSITMQFEADEAGRITRVTATRPPRGGDGLAYGRFLVEELKPAIDAQYRTDPGRTSLGGASLGGLITMVLGLKYSEVYDGLLVVAPSVWWDSEEVLDRVRALDAPTGQHVWLSMGVEESDGMRQGARKLGVDLRAAGWTSGEDFVYTENAGGHDEEAWSQIVPDMLRFLYGE